MQDQGWIHSDFGAVYSALNRSLEPHARNVACGTEAAISRALCHFRAGGDRESVARLEAIAMTICQLQRALRRGDEPRYRTLRYELGRMTMGWLFCAPMFPASHLPHRLAA